MSIIKEQIKEQIKETRKVYTEQQVRSAWQAKTDLAHLSLMLDDTKYYGVPTSTWQQIMEQSDTSSYKYIPEFRDCDDFAFLFKGELTRVALNGCGLVINYGGKHAYNVGIVADSETPSFRFIEPQNDQWIITDSKPCYSTNGPGIVII